MSRDSNKPKPTRIPVQSQISPEMEEKLRKRALAKEQRIRKYFIYRNIGIFLIVFGLPLAIYVYSNVGDKNRANSSSDPGDFVEPVKSLEFVLKNGGVSDLKKFSRSLDAEIATGLIPRQFNAYRDKLRISDELIRRDDDAYSVRYAVLMKINALSALSAFDRNLGVDEDVYNEQLLTICQKYLNDDDPDIRSTARLGELTAHIQNYLINPTEREFANVTSNLERFVDRITPDELTLKALPLYKELLSNSKNERHVQTFNKMLAERLQSSLEPELRSVGDKIMDEIIIGTVDFDAMRQLIQIPDQQTISKLESIVTAIVDNPNVSVSSYGNIFATVESLRRIKRDELEQQLMSQLRASAEKISDQYKQQRLDELFDWYNIRRNLVGQPFELGLKIEENPTPTVIIFFSARHKLSFDWVTTMMSLDELEPLANRYIIVCTDANLREDVASQIEKDFPDAILIGPDKNASYLQQCPVTHVPYIIILDAQERVVAVNVDLYDVRNHLNDLNYYSNQ